MSLTASMWTGVSGLLGHGEKMNVVGNNIANVSTVGFKAQRMDFEDYMYATTHSASGPAQIGRGVDIGIIMGDFSQGAFETTNSAVDLAIGGAGFFKVQKIGTEQGYYTRAGNFSFNTDGYLVDPHGLAVQGWKVDNTAGPTRAAGGAGPTSGNKSPIVGAGVPRDVRLDTWTVPPKQTTKTSVITNLAADGGDSSRNAANPFVSLIQAWDGTQPPPNSNQPAIAEDSFSYTTSIKVYDESGLQHTLTVYYDKVDPNTYNGKSGETMWEYMVTMNPAEDKRQVWDLSANGGTGGLVDMKTTKAAGVLMSGVMTFNAAGSVVDQTSYTLMGNIAYSKDASGNPIPDANYHWDKTPPPPGETQALVPVVNTVDTLEGITQSFYPAAVSQAGYPVLVANFGGVGGAQTAASPKGENYLMEFNQGLKVTDFANPWTVPATQSLFTPTDTTPNLTTNIYYTPDNQNGPKIVQKNPAYNESTMQAYQAALTADGGTPGANVLAWETAMTTGAPPPYASLNDAYTATWPYMPSQTTGFAKTQAQNATFTDHTPNTTDIGFINGTPQREPNATTMLGQNYATMNGTGQNGYTFGNLTGYDVDANGVLSGTYSNGVTLQLYQLTLYDFTCHQGLRREGGNLFSQTMESGEAFFGPAQTNGMGKINSYSLEQSNVDLAREFVQMITTQRGFQANSKVVTTTDTMLETVVSMKR